MFFSEKHEKLTLVYLWCLLETYLSRITMLLIIFSGWLNAWKTRFEPSFDIFQ